MATPKTLFLAWKDPLGHSWFTIGRLTKDSDNYHFVYTQGVFEAQQKCGFQPLLSFPRLDKIYKSTQLFPIFSNRLMSRSRPDYLNFMQWLNISPESNEPFAILARSGGERVTDTLAVFPYPELEEKGQYHLYFFSHGLQHLLHSSIERINHLETGEKLRFAHLVQDFDNLPALTLNTQDKLLVGYCPQYLYAGVFEILQYQNSNITVGVERVNKPPTPFQFRLLCKMTGNWSKDFRPFSTSQYQPVHAPVATATKFS
jgi:hypothetical protein